MGGTERDTDGEGGSTVHDALNPHRSGMQLHEFEHQGKSDTAEPGLDMPHHAEPCLALPNCIDRLSLLFHGLWRPTRGDEGKMF
jgi:hypothetical protein